MSDNTIDINLDKVRDISLVGVRRAYIFMGLGVNASNDDRLQEYSLVKETGLQLHPTDFSAKTINSFKSEFKMWIIDCGFRELLERFALYLDEICHVILFVLTNSKKMLPEEAESFYKKFSFVGISKKLGYLKDRFGYNIKTAYLLETLHKARNCMTHRLGVVGELDLCDTNTLDVKWKKISVFLLDEEGNKQAINYPIKKPFLVEGPSTVSTEYIESKKSFALGDRLNFNTKELSEICHFQTIATDEIYKQTVNFLKFSGVELEYK